MRPLSIDLRQRIIAAREQGESSIKVAKRFSVGERTVYRLWKRYLEQGHCRVGQIGGHLKSRLLKHEDRLTQWIEEQPDLTLEQLRERCSHELDLKVSAVTIWRQLRRMGLSYKKNDGRFGTRSG